MSYAGSSSGRREGVEGSRTESGTARRARAGGVEQPSRVRERPVRRPVERSADGHATVTRARGRPFDRHLELPDVDWGRVGGFGAGLALGALIGASAALLMTPHTGEETRQLLRRKGRRGARRAAMVWDELGDELRFAGERAGRKLRRRAERGRWQAEDWLERVRPARGRRRRHVEAD
ncbi:MAG TPA: hypothetical protein VGE02_08355 [Gemmatimonadales bacterium]